MEINQFYILIKENRCEDFIRYCEKYKEEIKTNPYLSQPLNTLIYEEIGRELEITPLKPIIKDWIETLYLAHSGNILKLSNEQFEKITVAQIKVSEGNIEACRSYAKLFPDNPICKDILNTEIEQSNNIIPLFPKNKEIPVFEKDSKPLTIKEKMKISILNKLNQKSKRITISNLYDNMKLISNDFKEDLYYTCLRELRNDRIISFGNINNIDTEVHLIS